MKLFRIKSDSGLVAVAYRQIAAFEATFAEDGDNIRHAVEFILQGGQVIDATMTAAEIDAFVKAWEVSQ
jgi:hypothetical protein